MVADQLPIRSKLAGVPDKLAFFIAIIRACSQALIQPAWYRLEFMAHRSPVRNDLASGFVEIIPVVLQLHSRAGWVGCFHVKS